MDHGGNPERIGVSRYQSDLGVPWSALGTPQFPSGRQSVPNPLRPLLRDGRYSAKWRLSFTGSKGMASDYAVLWGDRHMKPEIRRAPRASLFMTFDQDAVECHQWRQCAAVRSDESSVVHKPL
jgi:hypothetical protein